MKLLLAASEAVPYAKTGGLADVAGALPGELARLGHDARLVMPRYAAVAQKLETVRSGLAVELGGERAAFDLLCDKGGGYEAWFIDCPKYFDRPGLYGEKGSDYPDNAARFAFFAKALLAAAEAVGFIPDLIHSHDWQTALVPLLLKKGNYPPFENTATLFTIHNLAYMGCFPPEEALPLVGLGDGIFAAEGGLEYHGKVNYLKAGLVFADVLTTVSPTYAKEIQTPEFGYGLEGVLKSRTADLFGVLNGIDYEAWNPATDPHLAANYSAEEPAGKALCKAALQREYGLPERPDAPLFGMVTRLADQKGLDLFEKAAGEFFAPNLQFVLLGTGEPKYHALFDDLAAGFPEKCGVRLAYDAALAQRIYAGSDLFLMPSRYEPCGLGQLIALAYGTVPVVRATGGLADTIREGENGFTFSDYLPGPFFGAVERALAAYSDAETWAGLVERAFAARYSWGRSARRYVELYAEARSKRRTA
ncbi:MAG TPA: glycogen synthase GlgA [Candidatus Coatesbacteria bacterium]|nr:glycogen synthase GlgA [Candidatus Coatesbacteria bacterium]